METLGSGPWQQRLAGCPVSLTASFPEEEGSRQLLPCKELRPDFNASARLGCKKRSLSLGSPEGEDSWQLGLKSEYALLVLGYGLPLIHSLV